MGARKYEDDHLSEQIAEALRELGVIPTTKGKLLPPGDDVLRDRWVAKYPNTAFGLGSYRRFRDGYWPTISKQQIKSEISTVLTEAKAQGVHITSSRMDSIFALADVDMFVPDKEWNAKQNILIMQNGTLDITMRRLRKHCPDDYSTETLDYAYDAKARAPAWERYLNTSLCEVKDFVQEFAGYCLTTDTRHEIALWFVGIRGSGKSTGVLGFQTMLGPKVGWLGLADIERSQFSLVNLPGKNLCIATEQPAMYMKASNILNAIISGETVTIEKKFYDGYTFTPHTKILWSMNTLPRIADTMDGIFRRVKVVRFPPLSPSHQDITLKDSIATEGPGILNWALDGLDRLRSRGRFIVPSCVQEATDLFQSTNDVPAHFVSDMCTLGEYAVQSDTLYSAYKQWTIENGHKPQSSTSMASEWERLGFTRYRANGRTFYRGVKLNPLLPN